MAKKKKPQKTVWLTWQINGIKFRKQDVEKMSASDLFDSFINQFRQQAERQFRAWQKQIRKREG